MNQYIVRLSVPVYYDVQVSASSHELAADEAVRRFHDFQREPLDYGELRVIRATLFRTEVHGSSGTYSNHVRPRFFRSFRR